MARQFVLTVRIKSHLAAAMALASFRIISYTFYSWYGYASNR